jgi:hypothetical protein
MLILPIDAGAAALSGRRERGRYNAASTAMNA